YDIPSRFVLQSESPYPLYDPQLGGSIAYELRRRLPWHQPFVTHLNMQTTNDCVAYINKLARLGTNVPLNGLIIRAAAAGYTNQTFVLDNLEVGAGFSSNGPQRDPIYSGVESLLSLGVSTNLILYSDNTTTVPPWEYNPYG